MDARRCPARGVEDLGRKVLTDFLHAEGIAHFWAEHFAVKREWVLDRSTRIVPYANLEADECLMVLRKGHGGVLVTAWPEIVRELRRALPVEDPSYVEIMDAIQMVGFRMHGADNVFHLPQDYRPQTSQSDPFRMARIGPGDEEAFNTFLEGCSEQERSEAWIDLEHDCIYAAFLGDEMVCAGSIELWEDDVADVGVICLPTYRRRGLAQMVITALNQWCLENGYLPMYRCLKDNVPSAKLAERIGFRRFATWDVALEASCPAAQPPGHDAILLVSGSDGSKTTDSSE